MALAAVTAFIAAAFAGGFALGLLARWGRLDDPACTVRTVRARRRPVRQLRQWESDDTRGDAA